MDGFLLVFYAVVCRVLRRFYVSYLISFQVWSLTQFFPLALFVKKTSKTGLQRPAARYDGIGKIGGGYGFLVSMVSRVVSRCPWLPS